MWIAMRISECHELPAIMGLIETMRLMGLSKYREGPGKASNLHGRLQKLASCLLKGVSVQSIVSCSSNYRPLCLMMALEFTRHTARELDLMQIPKCNDLLYAASPTASLRNMTVATKGEAQEICILVRQSIRQTWKTLHATYLHHPCSLPASLMHQNRYFAG